VSTLSRRRFLAAAAGSLALPWIGPNASAQTRPNFLFVLVDDLGWADLGCYGNTYHETPHIDRLASQGMRFTNAYAACPVCSPTRASLMSGQYPPRVGITDFIPGHWRPYEKLRVPINRTQWLPADVVTVADALGGAGYACGLYGKWHLGDSVPPERQGFDDAVSTGGGHFGSHSRPDQGFTKDDYLTEELTALGISFMEAQREQPFFLVVSHYAVHIPLEARQNLILKYANKAEQTEEVCNPVYAAMIEHVDQSVGQLTEALDRLGLAENTVVVVYSDNGGLYRMYTGKGPIVTSNAPLRGEKGTLYEGGIREPLIVRWPGHIAPASVSDAVVTTPDFYPTFLEIAGAARPADHPLDGLSLVPVLTAANALEREAIYWHYPHYHHSSPAGAVRDGDWKLIEFYDDGRLELYDLREDIGESTNLAERMPDKAASLRANLAAWRDTVGAEMPVPNPEYDPARAHEWGKHPDRG
jgi:arylsulfatase A